MPTKRTRKVRQRRDVDMPEWAQRLLETGEIPERDSEGWDDYVAWKYFGDAVPGLPDEEELRNANKT